MEYFLSTKNEYDSLKSVRNLGVGLCLGALFGAAVAAPVNKTLACSSLAVSAGGGLLSLRDRKRLDHLGKVLHNCSVYEVESKQDIMVNHLGNRVEVLQQSIDKPIEEATLIQPIVPLDLRSLKFHHLMVLAPTGWGKSTVVGYLLDHLPGDILVVDPHATPRTWGSLPVAGMARNYQEIQTFIQLSGQEMIERYERRNQGDESYPKLSIVIDEFPAIAKSIGSDEFKAWIQMMLCEARKVNISLILLSQGKSVKTLGLEGQSELLENLTIIRGSNFAKTHARSLKDDSLVEWLNEQKRPATVDDDALTIPDLSNYKPTLNMVPSAESLKLLGGAAPVSVYNLDKAVTEAEPVDTPALHQSEPATPVLNDWTEITPEQRDELVQRIKNGESQNKIIEDFFKVRKGSNQRYKNAKKIYDEVKNGIES